MRVIGEFWLKECYVRKRRALIPKGLHIALIVFAPSMDLLTCTG